MTRCGFGLIWLKNYPTHSSHNRKPIATSPQYILYTTTTTNVFIHHISMYIHTGRFDREITILPPNAQQRLEILSALLPPDRVKGGECTLKRVADAAVGFVGADLVSLSSKAVFSAFMRGNKNSLKMIFYLYHFHPSLIFLSKKRRYKYKCNGRGGYHAIIGTSGCICTSRL